MNKHAWLVAVPLFFVSLNVLAGEPDNTKSSVVSVPKAKPSTADPNAMLINIQKIQKLNNDKAIEFLTGKIKENPKDADAYAKRGKAYGANKDYDHALADYENALKLNPKLADPYIGRAVIYLMKNNYDKSWESVHKAESLGGKFWPSFMDALKKNSAREK